MARLCVLFVASECVPLAKTGGLGDVVGALPQALRARGHDVRIVVPRYRQTKGRQVGPLPTERLGAPLGVQLVSATRWAGVHAAELEGGVPVYLIEHDELFDRDGLYGDAQGDFGDNLLRFAFLCRAAVDLCPYLGITPDIVHAHDWQASLVPAYFADHPRAATVLTIHNPGYQGEFSGDQTAVALDPHEAARLRYEHFGALNLLKGGVLNATGVSTVSPTYAREIQTPAGGAGLDGVLRERSQDLVGILNGIDTALWDPRRDPHLPYRFGASELEGKAKCKAALQAELGLEARAQAPLLGLVSRFAYQKGIDIFVDALHRVLKLDLQVAVLGSGDAWAEDTLRKLSEQHSNLSVRVGFDEGLAHRIEAGADLFAMPSRYEPCGLNQLYSQRYGTLPIVRAVGGLADTVDHEVTGFVFQELSGQSLALAIAWAADVYSEQPEHFRVMQRAAMRKPMGWDCAASQYDALYRLALSRRG